MIRRFLHRMAQSLSRKADSTIVGWVQPTDAARAYGGLHPPYKTASGGSGIAPHCASETSKRGVDEPLAIASASSPARPVETGDIQCTIWEKLRNFLLSACQNCDEKTRNR